MEQTQMTGLRWKSVVAGIMDLAAAGSHLLGIVALMAISYFAIAPAGVYDRRMAAGFLMVIIVLALIAAVLAVIGGIFALRRRHWGWALAGSIAALFPGAGMIFGVAAVIFTALAKDEFKK